MKLGYAALKCLDVDFGEYLAWQSNKCHTIRDVQGSHLMRKIGIWTPKFSEDPDLSNMQNLSSVGMV